MSLSSRIEALEIQTRPMADKIAREKKRDLKQGQTGRFGMLQMMAFGLTAFEAREEIASAYSRNHYGARDVILNSPHFDLEQAARRFQAFLDSDVEAAQLFGLFCWSHPDDLAHSGSDNQTRNRIACVAEFQWCADRHHSHNLPGMRKSV